MNHNHANFQARIDFIRRTLFENYNIEKPEISPIEYDPECPFKYNNFVYKIDLPSTHDFSHKAGNEPLQPGCTRIPNYTASFIMRLTNPDASGMTKDNRVENEVAIITLVAAALREVDLEHVVPSVFGWGSAADEPSQGWILQQLMPGTPLDASFKAKDLVTKVAIFAQIAKMLKAIQQYQLPQSIRGFGGLTYDEAGQPVSATMPSVGAGPWTTYEESYKGRLRVALEKADKNIFIKGWQANGLRERLETFINNGLPAQFGTLAVSDQKIVVHGDFTLNNILYARSSNQITALLDYDFACVLHPSYEFLRSFDGHGGQFRGWTGDSDSEQLALRDAKLHGFPSPLPKTSEEGVDWETTKAWEDELQKAQVQRPSTIQGIDKVADVDAILRGIMPWRVTNDDMLRLQSEEVIVRCRDEGEALLIRMLERLGY